MIWRSSIHSRIAQIIDFITVLIGITLSYHLTGYLYQYSSFFGQKFPVEITHLSFMVLMAILYVYLFSKYKAYSYQRFTSLWTEYINILKVAGIVTVTCIALIFLFRVKVPRTTIILTLVVNIILFMAQKTCLFYLADYLRKKGHNRKKILLIGTGSRAQKLIEVINKNFKWGLDIIGLLSGDEEKIGKEYYGYKVLDHYDNIEKVLRDYNPEEVIITMTIRRFHYLKDILETCEREGVQVRIYSDFFGILTKKNSY